MSEVRNGDQKVQKYLFHKIFLGRQEVHLYISYLELYFCSSVNIHGMFTYTLFLVYFIYVMCHHT